MNTKSITKISICIAILCLSSYIAFPLPFTPVLITAQTIIINLIALILNPKQSFFAILAYVLLGAFGLPVFSGGASGIAKIFSPTGGFIIGFLIAVPIISIVKGNKNKIFNYICATILVGIPIIYFFAVLFMCLFQKSDIKTAVVTLVLPFILGDIFKCAAASYISYVLNKVINYQVI